MKYWFLSFSLFIAGVLVLLDSTSVFEVLFGFLAVASAITVFVEHILNIEGKLT